MSETTEIIPAADTVPVADITTPEATTTPSEPGAAPEGGAEETPPEPPKKNGTERRFANLTRKLGDETRERERLQRELDAARALINAAKPETTDGPAPPAALDLEAAAARIVQEREFNRRLSEINETGRQEFGASWEAHKDTLTALGATSNPAFLQALAETENPAKLFAHFAEDTDALLDVLAKGPAGMAARIGRLDAQMSKPAAPKPLSSAPTPPARPKGTSAPPEPSPHDYPPTMSMREWNKMMDNFLPPSLGGKKRPS